MPASENPWPVGLVTILYTDLKDSSKTARAMGNTAYKKDVRDPHFAILEEKIAAFSGRIFNDKGDGKIAVFGQAQDALDAALAIQSAWNKGSQTLGVRMGLHTTEGQVPPASPPGEKPDYPIDALNYASRVESPADAGQILLSETTFIALNRGDGLPFTLHPHTNRYLKGFDSAPETLYDVLYDGRGPLEPGIRWLPRWYSREMNAFVGRVEWLKKIRVWLKESKYPLFVLRGFGGMGKTRLVEQAVLELGAQFPGGIHFVALDGIPFASASVESLFRALATAAEFPDADALGAAFEQTASRAAAQEALFQHLTTENKASLLILDNWESVAHAKGATDFVSALLRRVRTVRCLLTTRVLWGGIQVGEQAPLEGMRLPTHLTDDFETVEGSQFFLERARLRLPDFSCDTDAKRQAILDILQATTGFAFAIELVAARIYDYRNRLSHLAREISDTEKRLDLIRIQEDIGDGGSDAPRHASMDACIQWSVDHLADLESRPAFLRLGLFPASFTTERAEEIFAIPDKWRILYDRAALLEANDEGTFRLLPVVREFTLAHLPANDPARAAFADWYANLLEKHWLPEKKVLNIDDPEVRSVFAQERADILAASAETCNQDDSSRWILFGKFGLYLRRVGFWQEEHRLYERLLSAYTRVENQGNVAWALNEIANVLDKQSQWDEAIQTYRQSGALYKALGDLQGEAASLHGLANVLDNQGRWDEAIKTYRQSGVIYKTLGDRQGEAASLHGLANVLDNQGRWDEASQTYRQSGALHKALGDLQGEAASLHGLANVLYRQGRWDEAIETYRQSLDIRQKIGDRQGEAASLHGLANVLDKQGNWDEASQTYRQSLDIRQKIGDLQGEAATLASIGGVYISQGDFTAACDQLQDAIERLHALGDAVSEAIVRSNRSVALANAGRLPEAIAEARASVAVYERTQDANGLQEARQFLAQLEVRNGG